MSNQPQAHVADERANFNDRSTAPDSEKMRRVLQGLIDASPTYFFEDGFPRHSVIEQDARACLSVLAAGAPAEMPKPCGSVRVENGCWISGHPDCSGLPDGTHTLYTAQPSPATEAQGQAGATDARIGLEQAADIADQIVRDLEDDAAESHGAWRVADAIRAAMLAPANSEKPHKPEMLLEVLEFLMGGAPLEGVNFGDKHPTKAGINWWRLNLRAAMHAARRSPT